MPPSDNGGEDRFRNERRFYHGALIIALLLLFLRSCTTLLGSDNCGHGKIATGDTVSVTVKRDTGRIVSVDSATRPSPAPVLVSETTAPQPLRKVMQKEQYNPETRRTDTLWIFEPFPVDSAAIVANALKQRYYETTYPVRYGKLTLKDSVAGNRLTWQDFRLEQDIPEYNTTTTVTLQTPPRFEVYGMFELMGSPARPVEYAGGGLLFKTKSGQQFSGGVMVRSGDMNLLYKVGYYPKISLRKKR
jgi:hypothetical protein